MYAIEILAETGQENAGLIDQHAFAVHYAPLCHQNALDNMAGRFLISFGQIFQRFPRVSQTQICAIAAEQRLPPEQRRLSRLL